MSLQAARAEIAAAADAVAAVSCKPGYRQNTRPGDAMVRLDRTEYPNRFGGLVTWQVIVALPQTINAAEDWIDAHQGDLVTALGEVMAVRRAFPGELVLDTGKVSALFIEGQREE